MIRKFILTPIIFSFYAAVLVVVLCSLLVPLILFSTGEFSSQGLPEYIEGYEKDKNDSNEIESFCNNRESDDQRLSEANDTYEYSRKIAAHFNAKYSKKVPRKLVVFMDGTSNNAKDRTNIWRMYNLAFSQACDGKPIVPYYEAGVGTSYPNLPNSLFQVINSPALAFGLTASSKIRRAYRFLAEVHQSGDEIYIFGFSRGAFTARSLNGFIEFAGLIYKDKLEPTDLSAKLKWSPLFELFHEYATHHTGKNTFDDDLKAKIDSWQKKNIKIDDKVVKVVKVVKVKAIGVFDTVPARGLFGNIDPDDHRLNLYATKGFHALSLDEQRSNFQLLRFNSIDPKSGNRLDSNCNESPETEPCITETWFPGVHLDLGGGYCRGDYSDKSEIETCGLQFNSMEWMINNVERYGLFTNYKLQPDKEYSRGRLHDEFFDGRLLWEHFTQFFQRTAILRRAPLPGDKLHKSIIARMKIEKGVRWNENREPRNIYRPTNLAYSRDNPKRPIDEIISELRVNYRLDEAPLLETH